MNTSVPVSDRVRKFLDRQVAEGRHRTASEVLDEAVGRYEADLEVEDKQITTAVEQGFAALQNGDYIDVASPDDARGLWERIDLRVARRTEELRSADKDWSRDALPSDSG